MEIWEKINERYSISNYGRLWSVRVGIMKTPIANMGYEHANIRIDGQSVRVMIHQWVARYFVANDRHLNVINHKNGIKTDNRSENLEWCTHAENLHHSRTVLGNKMVSYFPERRKAIAAIKGEEIKKFEGIRQCARALGIPYQGIQKGLKIPSRTYFGWSFKYVEAIK